LIQSAPSVCLGWAGQGERRGTARGNSDDNVIATDVVLLSKPGGLIDRVLRAFHRPQQRIPASCNEQQQPLLRPTEGWNKFRAVLDGQSAGGSGADIDQPAGLSQSFRGGECRLQKGEAGGSHGGDCSELALDHHLGDVQRRPNVEIKISRAGAFGIHGSCGMLTRRNAFSVSPDEIAFDPSEQGRLCTVARPEPPPTTAVPPRSCGGRAMQSPWCAQK